MPKTDSRIDFEFLFFFTKTKRYFFELQFEPHSEVTKKRVHNFIKNGERFDPARHKCHSTSGQVPYQVLERIARNGLHPLGRNKRCVWSIPTHGFLGAHYATYPEALCEVPIRAGCPEVICTKCGKPRKKISRREQGSSTGSARYTDCGCKAHWTPGIVLDPFLGAGTTALAALKLRRRFIGIELNPAYVRLARQRLAAAQQENGQSL